MMKFYLVFLIIMYESASGVAIIEISGETYGPFVPIIESVSFCKGPRRNNCSSTDVHISPKHDLLSFKLQVKKETKLEEVKVAARGRRGGPGARWRISDPCGHAVFGPLLSALYRTHGNCLVDKGPLEFSVNLTSLVQQVSGSQFFYGTFDNSVLLIGSQCNMICVEIVIEIRKK